MRLITIFAALAAAAALLESATAMPRSPEDERALSRAREGIDEGMSSFGEEGERLCLEAKDFLLSNGVTEKMIGNLESSLAVEPRLNGLCFLEGEEPTRRMLREAKDIAGSIRRHRYTPEGEELKKCGVVTERSKSTKKKLADRLRKSPTMKRRDPLANVGDTHGIKGFEHRKQHTKPKKSGRGR
ncbi:MAG: hypothetical protein RLN62_03160 [Rickettsiales bacterium]